jgi:DNA-binding NtrC family response regulator
MPKRILVVDNDPAKRRTHAETVYSLGHAATPAESGDAALAALVADCSGERCFAGLIANSEAMTRVVALVERAASSSLPVLIEGESGVGKASIARAIQVQSARAGKPFIAVQCGSIAERELDRILFGSGSEYQPEISSRVLADEGTLFLHEIGKLPLDSQAKLLRVLRTGEIQPAGARHPVKVDIRLIAATSQNLISLVQEGQFREDLYYRLNVFTIWAPPLRHRVEDLPELVRYFIARFAAETGKRIDGIAAEAVSMLGRYDWPGNVRELENAVFRAVALAGMPTLTVNEFPQIAAHVASSCVAAVVAPALNNTAPLIEAPVMLGASAMSPATVRVPSANGRNVVGIAALRADGDVRSLNAIEADMIRLAFGRYQGRMTEIAKRLGIGRSTLYRKMREIGLEARAN